MPRSNRPSRRRAPLWRGEGASAGGVVGGTTVGPPRGGLIGKGDRGGQLLWSLPKGHVEAGETAEQAAAREVEEETGIKASLVAPLGEIDYWFVFAGRRIHKTVHHFLFEAVDGELSDRDIEVDAVEWVPLSEVAGRLADADEIGRE